MAHQGRDSRPPSNTNNPAYTNPITKRQNSNLLQFTKDGGSLQQSLSNSQWPNEHQGSVYPYQPSPVDEQSQSTQSQRTVSNCQSPKLGCESRQPFQANQQSDNSWISADPYQPSQAGSAFPSGQHEFQTSDYQGYGYTNAAQQSFNSPQQMGQYQQSMVAYQGPFGYALPYGQPSNSSTALSQVGYGQAGGSNSGQTVKSAYETSTYASKQAPEYPAQTIANADEVAQSAQQTSAPTSAHLHERSAASTYPSLLQPEQRFPDPTAKKLTAGQWADFEQGNRRASMNPEQGYFCVPCNYHFFEYTDLTHHEVTAHGPPAGGYCELECPRCTRLFGEYVNLRDHQRSCFRTEPRLVGSSSAFCKSHIGFDQHIKSTGALYCPFETCNSYGRLFDTQGAWMRHICQNHSGSIDRLNSFWMTAYGRSS